MATAKKEQTQQEEMLTTTGGRKLYARVTHIWGNRRSQPSRSAMRGPHPERTSYMIKVFFLSLILEFKLFTFVRHLCSFL